jgi:hypothetical protein
VDHDWVWDTLGSALIKAGFRIDASWPVNTESEASLHQAKKNSAASTILLTCRKRGKAGEPVWWDDLKGKVKAVARQKAEDFEAEGITGVDLYISTFGPVLAIISESWPVLTSESDDEGEPIPLKPGDALDLARHQPQGPGRGTPRHSPELQQRRGQPERSGQVRRCSAIPANGCPFL